MNKPKLPGLADGFVLEETGNTKVAGIAAIPGTASRKVFARGPIKRHLVDDANGKAWPIFAWLMLADGRWFDFHRVAKMRKAGVVDLEQVQMGNEIIISPGLIYRLGQPSLPELHRWRIAQDKIEKLIKPGVLVDENTGGLTVTTKQSS